MLVGKGLSGQGRYRLWCLKCHGDHRMPTVLSSLKSQPVCALAKVMDLVERVAEYTSLLIRMSTSSSVSISDS